MEVEYQLTPDDIFHFQWRASRMSSFAKRGRFKNYLFLFLCFVGFTVLPAIDSEGFHLSYVNLTWIAVVFPILILILVFLERRGTRRAIHELVKEEKPNQGQLGVHKITLNESGVVERTVVGESHTTWAGVHRIEQDRDYIFIYTQAHAAHVIPKRGFSSAQQAEAFYHFATVSKAGRMNATS